MSTKRTDEPNEVVTVGAAGPAWLAEVSDQESSLDSMQEYRVIPRIKLVQGTSAMELKESFGEGAVILASTQTPIAAKGESFQVVPIFGFTQFAKWSDIKDNQSPSIFESTYDKGSDLAKRSKDPKLRTEVYGEAHDGKPLEARYVEHLCFASMIYSKDHPLSGAPAVLSFQRGEFFQGKNFISAMMLRKIGGSQVPMHYQVWEMRSAYRDRGPDQKWWGLDFANPPMPEGVEAADYTGPYVTESEALQMQELYKEFKADYERNRLIVDRTDEEDVEAAAASEATVDC